jgi:hypothetical protein
MQVALEEKNGNSEVFFLNDSGGHRFNWCHFYQNHIGVKIISLGCVIGRRGMTIPLPSSILVRQAPQHLKM